MAWKESKQTGRGSKCQLLLLLLLLLFLAPLIVPRNVQPRRATGPKRIHANGQTARRMNSERLCSRPVIHSHRTAQTNAPSTWSPLVVELSRYNS
ncbi:hypothetical protein LY76DRAFT_31890 [Colletotrichum caudatum]|nr:hypothetical protein LY76DRAFT_31890 [Colletotrichum caudatum]